LDKWTTISRQRRLAPQDDLHLGTIITTTIEQTHVQLGKVLQATTMLFFLPKRNKILLQRRQTKLATIALLEDPSGHNICLKIYYY
jgi:hypothetical protein